MKLYFHPASTTSRAVLQFCAEAGIEYEPVVVDLMKGEHLRPPYSDINPNCLVPALDDDGFRLTESSAILKYLADKHHHPAYPTDLKQRARVNELMDWFNTGFYREFGYHLVYPQVFPHHKRPSDEAHQGTLQWGQEKSRAALKILNDHLLAGDHDYLLGNEPTIADYLGAAFVTAGDLIGEDFSGFPNIDRWLRAIRSRPSWKQANEVHEGFAASLKGQPFVTAA